MNKKTETKVIVKTGHKANQITSAKATLAGMVTGGGKLIDFFRTAYRFNKLTPKSEPSAFQAVNSACYGELGVSKAKTLKGYMVCANAAKDAKAEIIPPVKKSGAKSKNSVKKGAKVQLDSSPSEEQEKAFIAADPIDLLVNVISRMKAEKKMKRDEVEAAVKASLERVYKSK